MKITAIITAAATVRFCLDAAIMAARAENDSKIDALYVVVDPDKLVTASEEIQFQRLREAREGTAAERAEAAHAAFRAWSSDASEKASLVQWRSVIGAEEATVRRETVGADLLVMVHNRNMDAGDALHAAVWSTGKPVLLVPPDWKPRSVTFAHIAVALSDREAATDAIAAAMPWLRSAKRVTALRIGHLTDSAMRLCGVLESAGIDQERCVMEPVGNNKGAQIVAEAQAIGADLLVAGAYRHGPMVEWLLGGTTRHMLAAAKLPLLLRHSR